MPNTKPLVALACFCENVLTEKDDVVSAIRIVDTYTIPPLPDGVEVPPDAARGLIILRGLISLKSGDVIGSATIRLFMNRVTGERVQIGPAEGFHVEMIGGHHGVNLNLQIPLAVKNFGLVWFDVVWGDEVLTRMPLMLQQAQPPDDANAPS